MQAESPERKGELRAEFASFQKKRNSRVDLRDLFRTEEYPKDYHRFYAQSFAAAEFLIKQKGEAAFVRFLADGIRTSDWEGALSVYDFDSIGDFQKRLAESAETDSRLEVHAASAPRLMLHRMIEAFDYPPIPISRFHHERHFAKAQASFALAFIGLAPGELASSVAEA